MDKINAEWSVVSNLKKFDGKAAMALESHCIENIQQFKKYSEYEATRGGEPVHKVPAYIRLAMLYEKQGRFEDGINVCADAIKSGAYEDGTKGKMYGRLARLIKKSGIEVNDEIELLTIQPER